MTADKDISASELQVLVQYRLVEALQEREHDLAEAQRLARMGSWSWDVASGVVAWSDELYRIYDLDEVTFVPSLENFALVVHHDDRAEVDAAVEAAMAAHDPFSIEYRLESDGSRWVRSLGAIDEAVDGSITRMHGTVQVVTDEVATRTALAERDRRIATLTARAAGSTSGATAEPGLASTPVTRDPLTGLASHSLLRDYARQATARAVRRGWSTAVLVIDVDDFHDINTTHGPAAGDQVLLGVASRLTDAFRVSDVVARTEDPGALVRDVARLGGDRFVAICENVSDAGAASKVADRVRHSLAEPIVLASGEEILITVGIGAAIAGPSGLTTEQRIRDAESALHSAKQVGRDQVVVVGEGATTEHQVLQDAERALQQALERREFVLHYQAKLSLESDRIVGAEALLRWHDPTRGLVPPLEFIPLAEASGLIIPIGAWVIEQACAQISEWHRRFPRRPPLVVAVNVSGSQFGPDLIDVVSAALAAPGAAAGQLCVEVTESMLIGDADGAVETIQRLAALGVKVSIDDFGTGYSSLAYLKRLALHELKIDKSFVDGLGEDSDDTAIVGATVAMAHALGLSVIAEGVETAEQLERLRVIGCQEVQGYFVSRPMPAAAFADLLVTEEMSGWRAATDADPATPADAYRPYRVLVVDDTADVRQLARMSLSAGGFEVHDTADGADAVLMAQELRPDCVLLDVSMPGMSGIEVCRALRDDPRTAGCTIIMLTANTEAEQKIEAYAGGADDYIIKPFSPRDLVGRVRAALRIRHTDGPTTPLPSPPSTPDGS